MGVLGTVDVVSRDYVANLPSPSRLCLCLPLSDCGLQPGESLYMFTYYAAMGRASSLLPYQRWPCSLPCVSVPCLSFLPKAVHLHRVHNIDLFCRGVYYLRTSLLLCSKNTEQVTVAPAADKKGNAGVDNDNAGELNVETHGIPYMCLAQCEDMGTTVSHRKVPPMKVRKVFLVC